MLGNIAIFCLLGAFVEALSSVRLSNSNNSSVKPTLSPKDDYCQSLSGSNNMSDCGRFGSYCKPFGPPEDGVGVCQGFYYLPDNTTCFFNTHPDPAVCPEDRPVFCDGNTTTTPAPTSTPEPGPTTTTEPGPTTTTEPGSRLVVSFMTIQRSPVHPTPGISPSSKAPGSPSDKRTKEGIKDLHEELQQKLRSVDLEAQGAYKEVNRILSDSIVEGRYYKGSVSFMRECIIHLAELFGTKCEELAAERLLRIAAMEELSALKAAAERSEGEKEGRKRKRVKAKDARLQGPGDPVSPSHMDIDGVDTASVDTESVDTASVVTEGDGRALALPAPGPPGQRRIISRPQQRAKAGWVEVARRPPKPRKSPSEALQAQPREKRHLVLHVAIKVTEAGEGKPWPEASELDIQICRTKLGEAVAVHTDWKIVNTWKVRYGLAMEVADQKTFDDIVKIPPKDLVVRDLPGKRTELIIEGIPEEVGEEGTLRRELQLRNGITAGYEVIKISKKKGGNNAILRMDPEAARVLLEKGANRIPIYVGYSRVRVKPHVFTRVCFTCGLRHKAGEECTAAASCAWCGEEGHQMRECERLPSDPGRAFAAAAREFSIAGTDIVLIQEPPVRLPKWINTYKVLAAEGVERCRAGILVRKEVPHRITLAGRDYIEAEVKLEGASRWITISSIYLDRDIDVEMVLNRIKGNGWKGERESGNRPGSPRTTSL
ncbi:hypothetical protein FOL47_011275 [Perkinsus chesapeaki]|uniref:CCHC-type domain-containing protein n=1 Tax=Perkinsus chesapeaki TaxID=330153 RepID=A0A7J6KXI5_PERCH|nr:hypothetical protein FOL47_011275 [Perkinsus chesapeaki]